MRNNVDARSQECILITQFIEKQMSTQLMHQPNKLIKFLTSNQNRLFLVCDHVC